MLRPIYGWIALAALCAGPALAQTPSAEPAPVAGEMAPPAEYTRWQRDFDAAMVKHARTLAARGDARSLLAAALIVPIRLDQADGPPRPVLAEAQDWFDAARAARPAEPLVAWLEAVDVPFGLHGNADAATARLLQVDGDNAAVQWLAITAAVEGDDPIAARTHLRLAARADRFEPYYEEVLQLLLAARDGASLAPMDATTAKVLGANMQLGHSTGNDEMTAIVSMAQHAAIAIPGLAGVFELCQLGEDAPRRDAALQQDCTRLMAKLADDSTLIYQLLALPALVELTDGVEQAAWRERLREFTWLYEQGLALHSPREATTVGLDGYIRSVAADGEIGAIRKLMELNHVPLAPPAGWLPSQPRYRALVTGGNATAG